MTVEALSSNVVNYLVWRYLQEAGKARRPRIKAYVVTHDV